MKRALTLLVVVCCAACAGGAGGSSGSSAPAGSQADPCADVELDVEKVWGASIRAEFLGKGGEVAGQTREAVATKLDALSRDWVMLRRSVCLDHYKRQIISKQQYAERAACFDKNLQRQRSLVSALEAGGNLELDAQLKSVSDEVGKCGGQ